METKTECGLCALERFPGLPFHGKRPTAHAPGCPKDEPVVTYSIHAEQDDLPVRGNALASDDPAVDKECEDDILARLDRGEVWAWAYVKVTAECCGFKGVDTLGACSYKDEADFCTPGGYWDDMQKEARTDLVKTLKAAVKGGEKAARLLHDLGEES